MFNRLRTILERGSGLAPTGARAAGDTVAFLGVSVVVGVAVGAAAALLVVTTDGLQWVFEDLESLTSLGRWIVVVSVPTGLFVAWALAHNLAPQAEGDGVPEAMEALALHGGYLPTSSVPVKLLATASTLAGGGSAGREGPIVYIGATIGSSIARHTRLTEDQVRSLVAAGAGAAIGASFNAPIAGMLFAMEVILGSFATRHLSSVVVASVAAAVTAQTLVGSEIALDAPVYRMGDARELILYVLLGLLVVPVARLFLKTLDGAERHSGWAPRPWMRPLTLGLVVAAIGLYEPHVLGTGQEFITGLLSNADPSDYVVGSLLLIVVLKIVATATTLTSGGSGGAFFPSLFVGATLGTAFATFVAPAWGISTLEPGAFAVVGMAATFAAVGRAPLTAMLIVFEVTGLEYGLVLPLMLTTILATVLVDRIHPDSAYTMPLTRKGIRLVRATEVDLLDTVDVEKVMTEANPLAMSLTLTQAQGVLDRSKHHGLPVTDGDRLVGILTLADIVGSGGPSDQVTVGESMTHKPVTVTPTTPVSVALEKMAALGVGRLPVVAEDNSKRLVGMFRRESAVHAYHLGLAETTGQHLDRERFRLRTDPGAGFFDFRIPPGSTADGRRLREVVWPEGTTLVSIRRGRHVMIPSGNTELEVGDVVTAFGTKGAHKRLIERLNAGADEPTAELFLDDLAEPPSD